MPMNEEVRKAVRKGFMTSESCGPDKHYVLKIRFKSLADLQAAHNAILALSTATSQPEGDHHG